MSSAVAQKASDVRETRLLKKHAVMVARIDFNTDEFFPDRVKHVRQVALVVLRAKGLAL